MMRFSHSQLKLKKGCDRAYFYKYIMKLKEKEVETKWVDFGKAMHSVLEELYSKKNIDWQQNILDKWKEFKLEGRMDYNSFRTHVINGIMLNPNLTSVEKKIFLRIKNKYHFVGFLDIVDFDNDTILDWKSGTYSADKADDYKEQLVCYSYLYYRYTGRFPKKVSLFFNKTGKKVDYIIGTDISQKEILDYEDFVLKVGDEIELKKALGLHEKHWPQNFNSCFFCGYKYMCNSKENEMNFRIIIKNNFCFLEGNTSSFLLEGIDRATKFDLPNKFRIQKAIQERNDGRRPANYNDIGTIHLFHKTHKMFSLGLLNKIKKLLEDYCNHIGKNLKLEIVDLREREVLNKKLGIMPEKLITDKELRDYQIEAIEAYIHSGGLGYIEAATGSGKTMLTAEIIRILDTPTLWIIDKKELLYQTKKEFEKFLGIEIGVIGDGEYNPKDITIATIQTLNSKLSELKEYLHGINFAIVDEGHHASAESYQKVFKELRNTKYRLGTTGTAKRDDGTAPIMFSLIGDIIYKISAEELIAKGYLIKPNVVFYEVHGNGKAFEYHDDYKISVSENPYRNILIKKILRENEGKKILIIAKLVEGHGEVLKELLKVPYIHGSLDSETRKKYMEDFKSQSSGVLMATASIASEGLDIPDLDIIINASANKSDVKSIQALGRILRKIEGKSTAKYIDFIDTGKHTKGHSEGRMEALEKEGHEINIQTK